MRGSRSLNKSVTAPVASLFMALMTGCGGGGGDGSGGTTNPPPPAAGSFTMAASGASLSVARSASGTLSITVVRTGGFTGTVALQSSGVPSGVTVGFNPPSLDASTALSTMTVTVASAATTGTFSFTVQGSSSGQTTQSVTVSLTITAPPAQTGPFTLSISQTSHLIYPNNQLSTPPVITITRNAGFTGAVNFSVTGLPATVFLGVTPSSTSGNTATALALNIGSPNGTYTATITGTSSQGSQTITLPLVVAPPSTGAIKWKWCSASTPRYFVAARDGNGPWTRIVPALDSTYSFNVNSGVGEMAEVTIDSGGFRTTVYQYTAQEMAARAAAQCRLVQNVSTRTANGTFGGVTGFRVSLVGMGWWFGSANGNGSFSLLNLPTGPLDVIAARNNDFTDPSAIAVDRMILRRNQNPASGATMPVLDFTAAESFAPTTASWTFLNANGQAFGVSQMFSTANGSTGIFNAIPSIDGSGSIRTIYGVPQANTQPGDLHQVVATVGTVGPVPGGPMRATRQVVYYGRTLGVPDTLTFGPVLATPSVSVVSPGRMRAQGSLPNEYNTGVAFDITQTSTAKFFTLYATRGFMGAGSSYDVQMPDLGAVLGWDTQYNFRTGVATNWMFSGGGPTLDFFDGRYLFNSTRSQWTGAQTGIVAPADGATYYFGRAFGNTTP